MANRQPRNGDEQQNILTNLQKPCKTEHGQSPKTSKDTAPRRNSSWVHHRADPIGPVGPNSPKTRNETKRNEPTQHENKHSNIVRLNTAKVRRRQKTPRLTGKLCGCIKVQIPFDPRVRLNQGKAKEATAQARPEWPAETRVEPFRFS